MIKSASSISVEKILGKDDNNKGIYYKIPPYQREYSWQKENWEKLFDDILENDSGYFLGSIISIDEGRYANLIDGQQRLSTISLLLNALYAVITTYNETYSEEKILDYVENENKVLSYGKMKKLLFDDDIKLILSIQNQNQNDYEYLLFANRVDKNILAKEKPPYFGKRKVSRAFEYFKNRLLEVDSDGVKLFDIDDIFEYLTKVVSALMVKIEVDDISSAFTLFESINNRGIPLTPIDLIKNSIIGKIGKNPEQTNVRWQTIVKNIESYDDQVRFLRHYYHAFQTNPKVKRGSYIKATRSNIIKIYSEHIQSDVNFIFHELIDKSNIYTLFVNPDNIDATSSFYKYTDKLIDLKRLGVAPSYSLLLYLFSEQANNDLLPLLNFLENWFIRRHLSDFPGTSKLDQIFLDVIGDIYAKAYNFESIKEQMTTKERYLSDEKFEELLLNDDLYTTNSGATRSLLTKLEKSKRTKETAVDFWETRKNKLVWSIEHILPQNPDAKSDWLNFFSEEEMKESVHKLGNLTLTRYNETLSNKSYLKKISVKDSDGKDIGLKSSNVKINDFLKEKEDNVWDKDAISQRGKSLTDEILTLLKD